MQAMSYDYYYLDSAGNFFIQTDMEMEKRGYIQYTDPKKDQPVLSQFIVL